MMTTHLKVTGGRSRARRLLISAVLMLAGVFPVASLKAADPPASQPDVTVREERGVYSVAARFQVPQTSALALAVRSGAPIFAAEDVIAESAIEFEHEVEDTEEVVDKFKEFLDQVSPEDFRGGEQ